MITTETAWASKQEFEMFIFIRALYDNKLLFAYVMFPSCFILSYILSNIIFIPASGILISEERKKNGQAPRKPGINKQGISRPKVKQQSTVKEDYSLNSIMLTLLMRKIFCIDIHHISKLSARNLKCLFNEFAPT